MLKLFAASLVCLALVAVGLALGLLRARPLLAGCRSRLVTGGLLPGCEACPSDRRSSARDAERRADPRERGGATDAQRA